jgi:RNA polymerase sigma-70 factor (ECF subfamily)
MPSSQGEVTRLLLQAGSGKEEAVSKLVPLIYNELRRLAAYYLHHERTDHTLQATALVNEVYLKLVDQREGTWQNKAHFMAIAAQAMRRILIDHARNHQTVKRGGDVQKVPLDEQLVLFSNHQSRELLDLDEALTRLAGAFPRQSRVVELLYFGGLTVDETAEVLRIAPRTVKRDWSFARTWLFREMEPKKTEAKRPT